MPVSPASTSAPFLHEAYNRADAQLGLVHADLCGPINPPTPGGKRYFLLLVNDHSRYMWLHLLASKDQAPTAIKKFQAEAQLECRRKLRVLRTDRGGEFTSKELGEYFANIGVKRQLTAPYTPQQNGVVEWRNQTVVSMARSLHSRQRAFPQGFGEKPSRRWCTS
jgi:transposase InsO family protein